MRTLLSLAFTLVVAASANAAGISVDRELLVRDRQTTVHIVNDAGEVSGWTVSANYFPNSMVTRTDPLGVTDSTGSLAWKPEFAGIVNLTAAKGDASTSLSVSVRFPGIPAGAILVFIAAGMILLGGAGWSFMHLLERAPTTPGGEEDE